MAAVEIENIATQARANWTDNRQSLRRRGNFIRKKRKMNIGKSERYVSLASGAILTALGLSRRTLPGWIVAGIGGALIYRGATGHSYAYQALGMNSSKETGIHVEQAFLINRSPEDLYQHWRNFENLPRIITHLERVDIIDERRSRWVARMMVFGNRKLEWEAEITEDRPNEVIAWRSLPDSELEHVGQIRFIKALGDRGTEVHVSMNYMPPAGRLGHWAATLMGQSPRRQMREDLRNFKRLMETGEIPTIIGQPHGTCTGVGEEYSE